MNKKRTTSTSADEKISLSDARRVPWPVLHQEPRTGRPMGELLEANLLTANDLLYLAEAGYTARDRQAAKLLLIYRLSNVEKPSESNGPPQIISPDRWTYAEAMQHRFAVLQGGIYGLVIGLLIATEFKLLELVFHRSTEPAFNKPQFVGLLIVAVVIIIAVVLLRKLLNRVSDKIDSQIDNYRRGRLGEESVTRILQLSLDDKWTVYLNLVLPQQHSADMDAVLVGPAGIWVLEIKNLCGRYKNIGDHWEYLSGTKWKVAKQNATRQVKKNAARLFSFLRTSKIECPFVEAAIVWVNIDEKPEVRDASAFVWPLDSLGAELTHLKHGKTKLPSGEQKRVVDLLSALYATRKSAPSISPLESVSSDQR